jgi:acyl-CoA synthetase (AMP-forming)/AMP-acid ligase II
MTIHHSPYPPIARSGLTMTERVMQGLTGDRDRPVLIDGPSGAAMTAGQVIDGIHRLAGGLAARGIGPGSVVAVLLPNIPAYAVAFHGPLWAGATVTTINAAYTAPEIHHQLTHSRARLLITLPALLPQAQEAAAGTGVTEIAVVGESSWDALMGAPLTAQVPVDTATHIAVLPYSSGTTGLPKGVMLTHDNIVANVDQSVPVIGASAGDWTVGFLPFFHIYGQTVLLNLYLAIGGGVVTMPRFDLPLFLTLVARHRTPLILCAPPVVVALAKHPMVADHDLTCVKRLFSGAAPLSGDLADAVAARLEAEPAQGYGMTELSPVVLAMRPGEVRKGSVGRLVAGTEARIVDPDTGTDADEGELWFRGPQVMAGYLDNPDATAATMAPGGWLRTGDLGTRDPDGFFFIRDRLKELIKVSGFQVPPAEVEAALLSCPGVADAAVTARADEQAGEVPVAFVVRSAGGAVTEAEVMAHLGARLASYKLPRAVTFIDAVPKSASGKILRRLLKG